ncbi:DUF4132 domain-containing protein [Streptomyces sp. NPDC052042]|uniref:DUF4132 domain-containing protein n=1 Tax=Streptomyces sp. NPDC052042 TaxID=3365683 RepID=UPI0037CDFA65
MRRWEYVEGTASKFWETGAEGSVVTVRHGRRGSTGRTQTKEYASAEAAAEQMRSSIAEKEKKGYREVGTSQVPAVPTVPDTLPAEAPPVLPDEDTFTLPTRWKQMLLPRRGGFPRVPSGVAPGAFEKIDAEVAEQASWIQRFIDSPDSDRGLAAQLRAHLAGDPTPVGAALLTTIVPLSLPDSAWAHLWTERYGLPFAARAAAELFSVEATWQQVRSSRTMPQLKVLTRPHHTYWSQNRRPVMDRVRALLAAADEETYRAAVAALADCRTDLPHRIVVSCLVPSETAWVDELCADPRVLEEDDPSLLTAMFSSLHSGHQAALFTHRPPLAYNAALVATLAEGIGTALAPLLAAQFEEGTYFADAVKSAADSLVELPSDEAFLALLAHADLKHVRAALLEAMPRYPVRATRLLAAESRRGSGTSADRARRLLQVHLAVSREVVSHALPGLDAEVVEIVEPLMNPVDLVPDAPADTLAEVLTTPPWSRPRSTAKPLVVTGLTAESVPSAEWLPGERESWAATSSWYTTERTDGRWTGWDADDPALRHALGEGGISSAWLYIHGPEELVAPYLATWDPSDMWDAQDTFKPVVARFGVAALPVLLRVAPAQPASLAPVLLPFVDVRVARHMADWAARLKTVAVTARSWFTRHGVAAAPLLVPDAVGKAGPARRVAEQALTLVASLHGDEAVREAARGYGAKALAAVDALLVADPLERALPAKMPELPAWAEPALLPQVLVRSGGALPERSVRHAMTMLALSKPGEVYPGVASLVETAEAASLAEFAWALFEQWQLANMPAQESWVLHALGLLGDDDTVRRLTPVLRTWPGDGAHHRAVEGLGVLASIGSDVALLHLHGIAQRVKFKGLKARAQEKIAEVAAGLGLTGEQLADRLVPDLGLDADGSTVVDYGTRTFTVGFDEQLRPYVLDQDGKRRKDLPKPGVRDDGELAPAERKRFTALKKDVRTIASDQVRRLETAMVTGRSWTAQEFRELFVAHPLLWHLVRRLVWLSETDDGARNAFRVAEDRTFADVADEVFELAEDAAVRLAHPLHLDGEVTAWSEVFADYEILQPFPQLGRTVLALSDEEREGYRLTRFEGLKVPTGKVLGLERHGWERGVPQDAGVERWISKRLADDRCLVIALDTGIAVGVVDMFPEQTLETVWLDTRPQDHWPAREYPLRFSGLDPVTVSELLVDLTGLTEDATS